MADNTKQPQLNGAYYGPSIPPPSKTSHRPGRSHRGCGCCGCLFALIFKILITLIFIAGIVVLVFWLVFRPNKVKFYVTDATLTQFDLNTTTNNLYYDLSLNLTICNPNKHIGIYYDRLDARVYYEDQRFTAESLTPFYQGHKNTTELGFVFKSQNMVSLQSSEIAKYDSEKSSGSYSIDMKLYLTVRFKLRSVKTPKFKPKIECDLKVPLASNGNVSGSFETVRCGIDW
ncbi:NDR1/HIN1-like protein 10 [Camellia lanceoleosa]|uniref:NDR1/HIN1-like protein 10 n=1 Tax=Camellia lanceoleosa TaxID=1840588 RepID=A0ACC0FRR5_9ERIC|nr:NDR1/HIN1-like protein 10 [Camellia lanceoleosa]